MYALKTNLLPITLCLYLTTMTHTADVACPDRCACQSSQGQQSSSTPVTIDCSSKGYSILPKLLPTAEVVNFSRNPLTYIDESSFRGSQYLKVIDLRDTSIKYLGTGSFAGLPNLQQVYLDRSQLGSINPQVFKGAMSRNVRVSFDGNPWHCNCASQKVWSDLRSLEVFELGNIVCDTPKDYRGDSIDQIDSLCQDEMSGHDITILVLAALAVALTVLSEPLEKLIVKYRGQTSKSIDEVDRKSNEIVEEYNEVYASMPLSEGHAYMNRNGKHKIDSMARIGADPYSSNKTSLYSDPRNGSLPRPKRQSSTSRMDSTSGYYYETAV